MRYLCRICVRENGGNTYAEFVDHMRAVHGLSTTVEDCRARWWSSAPRLPDHGCGATEAARGGTQGKGGARVLSRPGIAIAAPVLDPAEPAVQRVEARDRFRLAHEFRFDPHSRVFAVLHPQFEHLNFQLADFEAHLI
jgi:hypothetical protein